jgi:RimJ/RimL family protein N-acetyltransferase
MDLVHEPEPATGQPVGRAVQAGSAARPAVVVLQGRFGRIEKLDAVRHGDDLWRATKDDATLWTYLGYGPFADPHAFLAWLSKHAAREDPYAYAVIHAGSGRALGIATLMETRPEMRVIEVGHILYGPVLQRTPLATEAQYLLARYAFETLGYRRYEWKCNALNAPSRRAAERYGFIYEGIFRQHMIVKGRNRDTAWYSMLDSEWPARRRAFEAWLAPDNFSADGRQKISLADLMRELLEPAAHMVKAGGNVGD